MNPPHGLDEVKKLYGDFTFHELSGGNVMIDGTFERDNVVYVRNVCGTGHGIQLHRLLVPIFEESLTAAMLAVPSYKVRMLGGYCPRHKLHDPTKSLSIHSWAAAFDINWDTNPLGGTTFDLPAPFVAEFTKRGWDWGGAWVHSKDWMHFQWASGI